MTSWHWHTFRITGPFVGNSPVTDWFPTWRRSGAGIYSFDVFFVVNVNKPLYKQSIAVDFKCHILQAIIVMIIQEIMAHTQSHRLP